MSAVDQAKNAEAFLEDTVHEERLDRLLWVMRMRRDAAAKQVPEWEELRTLASEIKEHTLSNLSEYLAKFEAKAIANGVTVHWARDAHEHNQIVYDLLAERKIPTLIKSKSMLTEECELDLVVLLDSNQIVRNIHDAYRHPYFKARPYSLLMTGPSGSADIGGVTVHPAQGVKTLTVILAGDPGTK